MAKRKKRRAPRWLHGPLYLATRAALAGMGTLPPGATVEGARSMARLYARVSPRRFARAADNVRFAFPDWDEERVRRCALASYEHLFMLGAETLYAPRVLNDDGWHGRVRIDGVVGAVSSLVDGRPAVLISGHVGNWEVLGYTIALLGFPMHAVYRPLDSKPLDAWVRRSRSRRGLILMDKFGAVRELPRAVDAGSLVGFVADQNGGDRGVFVPFFGRLTSSYKSIGLLAIKYRARVICGVARRLAPRAGGPREAMSYAMETVDDFGPEDWETHPDPLFYLTARYRWAIERMVRASPEQYLWLHRIWRSRPLHERQDRPMPPPLLERLRQLPWMTDEGVERLVEVSRRDARRLAETGTDRFS